MTDLNVNWNDEDAWTRLADGQLDAKTLRELTAACQRDPQLWKRCAIALLEEQVLRQEMKALAGSPLGAGDQSPALTSRLIASASPVVPGAERQTSSVRTGQAGWLNNLALVACVVIAFMTGWQASQRWRRSELQISSPQAQADSSLLATSEAQQPGPSPITNDHRVIPVSDVPTQRLTNDEIDRFNTQSIASALENSINPLLCTAPSN